MILPDDLAFGRIEFNHPRVAAADTVVKDEDVAVCQH